MFYFEQVINTPNSENSIDNLIIRPIYVSCLNLFVLISEDIFFTIHDVVLATKNRGLSIKFF